MQMKSHWVEPSQAAEVSKPEELRYYPLAASWRQGSHLLV